MGFLDKLKGAAKRALARGRAGAERVKSKRPTPKPKPKPDRTKQREERKKKDREFLKDTQEKVKGFIEEKIAPKPEVLTKEQAEALQAASVAAESGSPKLQEQTQAELIKQGITTRDIQRTLQERPELLLGSQVTKEDKRREAERIAQEFGVDVKQVLQNPEFNKQWKAVEQQQIKDLSQRQKQALSSIEQQKRGEGILSTLGRSISERGSKILGTGERKPTDFFKPSILKPKETVGIGLTTVGGVISGIGKPIDVAGEAFRKTDSDILSKLEAGTRAGGKEIISGTVAVVKDIPKVFTGPTAGFTDKQLAAVNIQRLTGVALLAAPTFKVTKGATGLATAPFKPRTRTVLYKDKTITLQKADITSLRTGKTTAKGAGEVTRFDLKYKETALIDLKKGKFGREGTFKFEETGKAAFAADIKILDITPEGAKVLTISKPFKELGTSKQPAGEISLVKDIGGGFDISRGAFKRELTRESPILKTAAISKKLFDPIELGRTRLSPRIGLSKIEGQPPTGFRSTLIETPKKKKSDLGRLDIDIKPTGGGTFKVLQKTDTGAILETAAGKAASKIKVKADIDTALTQGGKTITKLQTKPLTQLKTGTALAIGTKAKQQQLQRATTLQLQRPLSKFRTDTIALQKTSFTEITSPLQQTKTQTLTLTQLAKPTAPSISGLTPLAGLGGIPFRGKLPELGGRLSKSIKKSPRITKGKRQRVASVTAAALRIKATKKQAKKKKGFTGLELIGLK